MVRKSDYRVAALNKVTEASANVGAAWKNEDGTIALILNDFVVLQGCCKELLVTLFPNDKEMGEYSVEVRRESFHLSGGKEPHTICVYSNYNLDVTLIEGPVSC